MLESQLEVVKSPEWTDLLAKDDLAEHKTLSEEIDMTELDNQGDNQVNSTSEEVKPWGEIAEDQVETTQTIVFPGDDQASETQAEVVSESTEHAYNPIESSTDTEVEADENKN